MRDALAKDRRIHRDISAGNIILLKEPGSNVRKGFLIDWETSCRVDESGEAVETGRVVSNPRYNNCANNGLTDARCNRVPGSLRRSACLIAP